MQWNFVNADILYSGHISRVDIIFMFQFTLPPRTDLFIADTPNSRPYKTLLVKNMHTFYFGQCFAVSFRFSSILVILFFSQFNGFFRYKIAGIFSSNLPPWLTRFLVAKMSKAQWSRDTNIETIMHISIAHGQLLLLYSEN